MAYLFERPSKLNGNDRVWVLKLIKHGVQVSNSCDKTDAKKAIKLREHLLGRGGIWYPGCTKSLLVIPILLDCKISAKITSNHKLTQERLE